ncbi:MAG: lipopolysaccharide kinase InaA family protein [Sedimentisphaeraceae bacterium JB056]
MNFTNFTETSPGCLILNKHVESFKKLGLCSVDDFVSFNGGEGINTKVLPKFRNRLVFKAGEPEANFYLKTYNKPPLKVQVSNWLDHGNIASTAAYDYMPALELESIGVKTPVVAAFGEVMSGPFEKKSFIVTEEIVGGVDLEKNVPEFFKRPFDSDKHCKQMDFVRELARFSRDFHNNGFRHRDFYLAHIFWGEDGGFQMIDLQRVFKPKLTGWKYRLKDIAQLYYSAPSSIYSRTARLRFYKEYAQVDKLSTKDRWFIKCLKAKVGKMAVHDEKKGKPAPFKM